MTRKKYFAIALSVGGLLGVLFVSVLRVLSPQPPYKLVNGVVAQGQTVLAPAMLVPGTCSGTIAVPAKPVSDKNALTITFASDPTDIIGYQPSPFGILSIISYPTDGAVNFKVCNNTAGAITPGAIALDWIAWKEGKK